MDKLNSTLANMHLNKKIISRPSSKKSTTINTIQIKLLDKIVNDVQNDVNQLVTSFLPKNNEKKKEKKLKDPNAPKRPKNGYLFFCQEQRDKVIIYLIIYLSYI
jgi:hypothetical protein